MLSFPKLLRTQKSPFVICPVAMCFLTVVIASLEYFLGSFAQSYLTLCNPVVCSTPGFPVLHHLLEFEFLLCSFLHCKKERSFKSYFGADSLLTVYNNCILSNQLWCQFQKLWNYFICYDSDSFFWNLI